MSGLAARQVDFAFPGPVPAVVTGTSTHMSSSSRVLTKSTVAVLIGPRLPSAAWVTCALNVTGTSSASGSLPTTLVWPV